MLLVGGVVVVALWLLLLLLRQSWFYCFRLRCSGRIVRSGFLLLLFCLFLILIRQCKSSGILLGGYLLLMVTSASCCRAVVGVSCFFASDSKERLVWNDWYSVGAVAGLGVFIAVGICSCFR